ncbi:netrin receptor DCC-like [Adelges cooleyi]|uniref:netrin receptor DCC-like n=1 Tax=Adelges cooleyi TaxID=133065 RepID=UPI0021808618|nr:netrin receptor DCC-like [Adelges cooleyi]
MFSADRKQVKWKCFWLIVMFGTVQGSVKFVIEPKDIVTTAGETVRLDCEAKFDSVATLPKIRWRIPNQPNLDFIGDTKRTLLNNGSLLIKNVFNDETNPSDGLEAYQCVAFVDDIGSAVSRIATIILARLSPFEKQPTNLRLFPGQTAYFSCVINSQSPQKIVWLKDHSLLIIDGSRMTIFPSIALEIVDVLKADAGEYRCNVTGLGSYRLSDPGVLTIDENEELIKRPKAPEFIAKPHSTIALEGSVVSLDCAAIGNPRPRISWLKEDGALIDVAFRLLDSRYSIIGTGGLQITQVNKKDNGNYVCRAENGEGSADVLATLEIQVKPQFIKKPKDTMVVEKEDIVLDCEVEGKPTPQITWLKNGDQIKPGEYLQFVNGTNLKILRLMTDDSGMFQCLASNPAGNIQSSAFLNVFHTVLTKAEMNLPGPPLNVTAMPISSSSIFVSWNKSDQGNKSYNEHKLFFVDTYTNEEKYKITKHTKKFSQDGLITGYKIQYRKRDEKVYRDITTAGDITSYQISGLEKSSVYQVRLWTLHTVGKSPPTDWLTVETYENTLGENTVPDSPTNFKVRAFSNSLLATWSPPKDKAIMVREYTLGWGKGIPNVYTDKLSPKSRQYEITNLEPGTKYVLSIGACNDMGVSPLAYQAATTRASNMNTLETNKPLIPPIGLKTNIISSNAIEVSWTDNTLLDLDMNEDEKRLYVVRYNVYAPSNVGYKTFNTTKLSCIINSLKPNTQYEFTVKLIKGELESEWSMLVSNYTKEAKPASPPRDLAAIKIDDKPQSITLNWQPPIFSNGKNGKSGINITTILYILIICCLMLISCIGVGIALLCCKQNKPLSNRSKKEYIKGKTVKAAQSPSIKPPDLWIHPDQMEQILNEKSSQGSLDSCSGCSQGSTNTYDGFDTRVTTHHVPHSTNSLDKSNVDMTTLPRQESSSPFPFQHATTRAHVTVDLTAGAPKNNYIVQATTVLEKYESIPLTSTSSLQQHIGSMNTKRQQGHPLKSFSVPAPLPQSVPSTPQQKPNVTVRPQGSSGLYKKPMTYSMVNNSPTNKSKLASAPKVSKPPTTNDQSNQQSDLGPEVEFLSKIQTSNSTEELNQEMANLGRLMKDLNAITASKFQC